MLTDLLNSPNPMVRYGVAALLFFGPLYILQSFGLRWPFLIAVLAFGMLLIRFVGEQAATFKP